jgi:Bacterial Ig-like domain (group 3)
LGTGTYDSVHGVWNLSTSSLAVGGHSITAIYGGDANFNSSTSSALAQSVNKAPTTWSVMVSPNPAQYSDQVTFTATITPGNVLGSATATAVTFTVGSQTIGTVPVGADGVGTLITALLEPSPFGTAPIGQMAPGNHTVTAVFSGLDTAHFTYPPSSPATTLTISPENALATYSGALMAWGSSTSATTAAVTLSATVQDVPSTTLDPAYGDIRNAKVTFINRDTKTNIGNCIGLSVGLVNSGDTTTGTSTCTATLGIANGGSSQYTIGIIVGNYYTRNDSGDDTVVTVSQPLVSNFITGGGYLVMQNSAGLYPGQTGTRNNFGFNVKYNNSGTNLQGNLNVIVRNAARVYQIKGNSMTSLAVNYCPLPGEPGYQTGGCTAPVSPCTTTASAMCPISATFNGKASIQDITDPLNPVSIDGNATLQVTMTDNGSGSADTIGITVWNKSGGLWFSSAWLGSPPKTTEQALAGGTLKAH